MQFVDGRCIVHLDLSRSNAIVDTIGRVRIGDIEIRGNVCSVALEVFNNQAGRYEQGSGVLLRQGTFKREKPSFKEIVEVVD
jgi:hypothetical protein